MSGKRRSRRERIKHVDADGSRRRKKLEGRQSGLKEDKGNGAEGVGTTLPARAPEQDDKDENRDNSFIPTAIK